MRRRGSIAVEAGKSLHNRPDPPLASNTDDDDDARRNLAPDLVKLAIFIAMKIDRDGHLVENTPQSVAAGVVYFVATLAKTVPLDQAKARLSGISDISAVTIVKCYKKIAELSATMVPPSIAAKYAISRA